MEQSSGVPDLAGAEVFVEVRKPPVAGGRWYVQPDATTGADHVTYQRPNGEYGKSLIAADTLRSSPTWQRVDSDSTSPS